MSTLSVGSAARAEDEVLLEADIVLDVCLLMCASLERDRLMLEGILITCGKVSDKSR